MKKKILIITYYWPPAGGPGVQRWLKFTKYLPQFDWNPIVYVPENPNYPLRDESLLEEIPPDITILKNKIWEPYHLAELFSKKNKNYKEGRFDISKKQGLLSKISIWIRGNFFIPDARVFWVKPSISYLKNYLENNKVDLILTSGPPHSMHLIGLKLKKIFPNIPWVADFRDPWTKISYHKHLKLTKYAHKRHQILEKKVFTSADAIFSTSYADKKEYQKIGAKAYCITNGFDSEMQNIQKNESNDFIINYSGILEQLRNPRVFWKALKELIDENENFSKDLKIQFVGKVDEKIKSELLVLGLEKKIEYKGYLSHNEAIKYMKNASLLLLCNFDSQESKGIIPGKFFEYLASENPVIAFGSENSDVEFILKEIKNGQQFYYSSDIKNIKDFILECYEKSKKNDKDLLKNKIQKFHRKEITQQMVEIFNQLMD